MPPLLVVLRPLGLGDLLTAVPALRALAEAFPGHRRVLAAPSVLEPLALMTGAVDAVVDTAPLRPLAPELRHADVAVDLHGKGPASHRVLLASRPGRLVAFANPDVPGTGHLPRWRDGEHEVHRWCRLLAGCGIAADPSRLDLDAPPLEPPPVARGATVVHPGAAYPARRWPPARWAAVARHEQAQGRPVVVTGGPGEEALASDVAAQARLGSDQVLAGGMALDELAAVVAAAGRVASADTGVAHLATALRTPSVVLFGPEPPARWGPPPDRPWHRGLWAGRRGDPRGASPDPGLLALGVDDVVAALDALPDAPVSAGASTGSRRSTR